MVPNNIRPNPNVDFPSIKPILENKEVQEKATNLILLSFIMKKKSGFAISSSSLRTHRQENRFLMKNKQILPKGKVIKLTQIRNKKMGKFF